MSLDKKLVETFRVNGYRVTPQRITITQMILKSREHPTAEQLYEQVVKIHPTISLSTIYNTLKILKGINILNEISHNDMRRFDANPNPHVNLVCEICGKITDVEEPALYDLLEQVTNQQIFTITNNHINVYGMCKYCKK
jgi:Fur family transcriptional regulator, peroxide stress response regulator